MATKDCKIKWKWDKAKSDEDPLGLCFHSRPQFTEVEVSEVTDAVKPSEDF